MSIFVLVVIISGVLSLPCLCCAAIVLVFMMSALWLFLTCYCESSCCKKEQCIKEKYYQAYYCVQQLSKKEDISIMEAQVAFLQAMSLPIALVAMVSQLAPDPVNCVVRVFFLILFLGIFPMVYHRVKKIHSRVWEDYEFLRDAAISNNSKNNHMKQITKLIVCISMLFMLMPLRAFAERIPVAILRTNADGKTKTLTFTYAEKPKVFAKRGQDGIHKLFEGIFQDPPEVLQGGVSWVEATPTWLNIDVYKESSTSNEAITKVVFDKSFAQARPTSTSCWFLGMKNLTSIEGMEYLDTSSVKYMVLMFKDCSNLEYIDVSRFNTENVEDMLAMFKGCSKLKRIDVSGFKTRLVGTGGISGGMESMFKDCSSLEHIDVSGFVTASVGNMARMFEGCSNLKSINISGFSTSQLEWVSGMFKGCTSLKTLTMERNIFQYIDCKDDMGNMFMGVGTLDSPCLLVVEECFDNSFLGVEHGEAPNTFYRWNGGYFTIPSKD